MSIAGIITGILLFVAAVLWIASEIKSAPYNDEGGDQ